MGATIQSTEEQRRQSSSLVDLSVPDNTDLVRGAPKLLEALWYFAGLPLLRSHFIVSRSFRPLLLRLFGARVGVGSYIKPGLRVKFPWYLEIGDHCWLGEDLWIDNLARVTIGSHVCVSQGVYLCTGNHDWSTRNMKLFRKPIHLESGCWVGAKAVVCPGIVIHTDAIVTAGAVVTNDIPSSEVWGGNPVRFLRHRVFKSQN